MWIVAINPKSGGGRGLTLSKEVVAYFDNKKIDYKVVSAPSAILLKRDLEDSLNRPGSIDGVISVGGDGLAHLILQSVVPRKIPFAVIPAGTGNDIARTLGWSLDNLTPFLDRITSTQAKQIDLGIADSEWFAAILSTGFDSIVNERANRMPWPKGPQRYNVAIALELPRFVARNYTLQLDGQKIHTEAALIAIGNGRSYGGGMYVCPQAKLDDGLFDIMILKPLSKIEFLKVFPSVYSGSHINHPAVEFHRAAKVSLEADAVAYADGERIGQAPISAECIAGAGLTWKV